MNYLGWLISFTIMAAVIFGNYPLQQPKSTNTKLDYGLYDALSRVGWALALCYIIFACVHGYGGPINWFLSLQFWLPLSRLSYAIYLIHFPIILMNVLTMKQAPYFNEMTGVRI